MATLELKEYTVYEEIEILQLYQSVGWNNYTNKPEVLKVAYEHSLFSLGAYIEDELVGIIRVVGDSASIIFVQDLLIHPDFQRQGIGKKLLTAILEKYQHVRQKALLTDDIPASKGFYTSVDMTPISEKNGICFVKYTF